MPLAIILLCLSESTAGQTQVKSYPMIANFWRKAYRSGWLTGIVIVLLVTFNTLFSAKGATTVEGFETGSKGSYAAADVTLSTGVWNLDDALIGNLAGDAKSGTQSTRIRNSGKTKLCRS